MSTNTSQPRTQCVAGECRWKVTAAVIGLVVACSAAYANSLQVPFIFDDTPAILENATIHSLASMSKLRRVLFPPREGQTVQGRPILNLTFALNYAWTKDDVWSWHVVNIAIHALAGICLFGVARETFLSPVFSEWQRRRATFLGFSIALLWTLHPLETESVTYIVQRAESLAGLWLLLTLYCSIRGARSPRGSAWQIAAVAACSVGMATKEVMVAAPLLVVLYDWSFSGESLPVILKRRWGFYTSLAGTWLVLGALLLDSFERGGSAGLGQGMTSWEYARTQFGFIAHYLWLSFWPHPLVLDYGTLLATDPVEIVPAAFLILTLGIGTIVALARPAWRPLGFLGAWFFCILAPSSSVVPVVTQTGAEHRMYLPLAAVVALIVVAVDRVLNGYFNRGRDSRLRESETDLAILDQARPNTSTLIGPALLCVVALTLGIVTARRNFDYRSVESIWRDVAAKRPENYRALNSLGMEMVANGEITQAIELFDRSIQLKPDVAGTFNIRGDAYMQLGNVEEAKRDFQRARDVVPHKAAMHLQRGIACAEVGDWEGALAAFTLAAKRAPNVAPVRWRKGTALAELGRHTEAIDELTEAIRLNPDLSDAYRARALSYMHLKRYDLARADLAEMKRLGAADGLALAERLENEAGAEYPQP